MRRIVPDPRGRYGRSVTDFQRIFVVSTKAGDADVGRLRARLGRGADRPDRPHGGGQARGPGTSGCRRSPTVLLAPVSLPDVDRGHRLDEVVRRHAVEDRFRDVVVVADPATITLLLRILAPDQLPTGGPVIEVGLPRGPRPVPLGRAAVGGVGLALVPRVLSRRGPRSGCCRPWPSLAGLVLLVVPGPPARRLRPSSSPSRWPPLLSLLGDRRVRPLPRRLVTSAPPAPPSAGVRRSTTTIAVTVSSRTEASATTPGHPAPLHALAPRLPKTEEPE